MLQASPRSSRPPRERLASVKDTRGGRITRRPTRRSPQAMCPYCKTSNIAELDGAQVCADCGATLNESNIVAEVTFGESSAGAAVVQGGYVGEGARHANTLGPAFRRAGGGMESREVTENQGRDEIRRQANSMNLSDSLSDQAFSIYKLAANANFIQGRRVNVVAAVCLYVACRRDRHNQTLLMDFSEAISVNVFKLGQTYQHLKSELVVEDSNPLGIRPVIDVENLILKFARKLEFGSSLYKVAEDAARIMKRMKRDWMVTGRRPSGLCGACIILAARMNNFRRTVREVVYVVKVADITVAKRLEEFKNTQSSDLTVDQFREFGVRLKTQHDPPALYERLAREKEQRVQEHHTTDHGQSEDVPQPDQRTPPVQNVQPRRDSQGFAIPAIPVDPSLFDDASSPTHAGEDADGSNDTSSTTETQRKKRKYKRSVKAPRNPPPAITEADLAVEADLEDEMEEILKDPTSLFSETEPAFVASENRARDLADSLRKPSAATAAPAVSDDPEIGADEFENDPEVANCLLSEEERRIKERIWVTHNEDWLRAQQAKILKKALDEANGTSAKPKQKRKRGRMGDGSVLDGGTPVEDAADATQRMLEKRGNRFSKHINYEKLSKFYAGTSSPTDATTTAGSDAGDGRESDIDGDEDAEMRSRPITDAGGVPQAGGALPTPPATQEVSRGIAEGTDQHTAAGDMRNHGREEDPKDGGGPEDEEDEEEDDDEDDDDDNDEDDVQAALDELGVDEENYDEEYGLGFDEVEQAEEY